MALAAIVFWVIGSICLHELGHGVATIRMGDRTPIETGHMTWNPIVHMGWMGIIVFLIIGIAWGAMPVNPNRWRHPYAGTIVALAGPAVNLVLAVLSAIALGVVWATAGESTGNAGRNLETFFWIGAQFNFVLLLFNLIPVPPLDGSRVLADLIPAYRNAVSSPKAAGVGLLVLVILLMGGAEALFGVGAAGAASIGGLVAGLLGGAAG